METITIKKILYEDLRLEFKITGINNTIINCIRRIALSLIPIYSFNSITISENTSIFNNNYMKLRLRNLPVFGISADNAIYDNKKKIDTPIEDVDNIGNDEIEMINVDTINSSSLKQLTMYLDYTNNTKEIITVGTDDCKFYYAEKQIDSPYRIPKSNNIPIIKLQPDQKIKLSAITELGIEEENAIFSALSIFTFKELTSSSYEVALESRGQLNEVTILNYTIENIIYMLNNFLLLIPNNSNINAKILLDNADHTIGTLIALGLQEHKKVKFAGYNMPHLLDNKILFHYELIEEYNIKDIMEDIVVKYKKIFTIIKKEIDSHIK